MPSLADIESKSSASLNLLEKEIVRHIIGINGRTSSAVYLDSEERFLLLSSPQNQLVRALISEYEDIDNTTTAIRGGSDGLDVSFRRDAQHIASQLRRIMYPTNTHDPLLTDGESTVGTISFVPVTYASGSTEFD